jgi:hypothetical protein
MKKHGTEFQHCAGMKVCGCAQKKEKTYASGRKVANVA